MTLQAYLQHTRTDNLHADDDIISALDHAEAHCAALQDALRHTHHTSYTASQKRLLTAIQQCTTAIQAFHSKIHQLPAYQPSLFDYDDREKQIAALQASLTQQQEYNETLTIENSHMESRLHLLEEAHQSIKEQNRILQTRLDNITDSLDQSLGS